MDNKTDYAACLKNSVLPELIKLIFSVVFMHVFTYVNIGLRKINTVSSIVISVGQAVSYFTLHVHIRI